MAGFPAVLLRALLSWCLAELGGFADGLTIGEEAIRIAESVDQPFSMTLGYVLLGSTRLSRGDLPEAIAILERGLAVCRERDTPVFSALMATQLASAYASAGRGADGLALVEERLPQVESGKVFFYRSRSMAALGEACLLMGRGSDARRLALRAIELTRQDRERGDEAWTLRLLGKVAVSDGAEDEATFAYRDALALATELGMRPLVAHCHLGLGKLYRRTGKRKQAQEHLTTATTMYREMDMRFWLEQAEVEMGGLV
jgi:tetratricopeptide (TPR) repeat protein